MLKKITLVAIAFIASSGIAFADPSDNTTSNSMDTSADASNSATPSAAPTDAPKAMHHKHHKSWCKRHPNKCHKHKHHYTSSTNNDGVMVAPAGGYKGEVAAAPCPACIRPFNTGAYVGIGVGSRVNYVSRPAAATLIDGTIFGGYSMLWDQFYGALEIFGQDDGQINNYRNKGRNGGSVTSSWGYGISVIPGYLITDDVLGYLRLGVLNTRFSGNTNATGGQVGLGMQTALNNCWDLRGEWQYNFYNSIHIGVPRSQQFNLGLLYKFQI